MGAGCDGAWAQSRDQLQAALPLAAQAQQRPACGGTLLKARGQAEQKRSTQRLRFSLALEAEGASADGALIQLKRRRALVHLNLQLSG